jgi:glutathionyl-hydroquinone reductase
MNAEKETHLYERQFKREAKRTWERVGSSFDGDEDGEEYIRYTLYDSTTGPTAFHRMMFHRQLQRQLIAGELRRMRAQLRELVREGPNDH